MQKLFVVRKTSVAFCALLHKPTHHESQRIPRVRTVCDVAAVSNLHSTYYIIHALTMVSHREILVEVEASQHVMSCPCDSPSKTLLLHDSQDTSLLCKYSNDRSLIALSSKKGDLEVRNTFTGEEIEEFTHKQVTCCAFSWSGKFIASASGTTVQVWDGKHRKPVTKFTEHTLNVQCCDFSPDERLIISADALKVTVWDVRTGDVQSGWQFRHKLPKPPLNFAWKVRNNEIKHKWHLNDLSPSITSEELESDSTYHPCDSSNFIPYVVLGCPNGNIKLLTPDLRQAVPITVNIVTEYKEHEDDVKCVAFSHDKQLMASACLDRKAKIWNINAVKCEHTLVHSTGVLCCEFSPDDSRLVTAEVDVLTVWSVKHEEKLQRSVLKSGYFIDHIHCSTPEQCLLSAQQHSLPAGDNRLLKIVWCPYKNPLFMKYDQHISAIWIKNDEPEKPDEPVIVCYESKNKKLQIIYKKTVAVELPTVVGLTPCSWLISEYYNNSCMVAVGYKDGTLQMISLTHDSKGGWKAEEVWQKKESHDKSIFKCIFVPDGKILISCSVKQHKSWDVVHGVQQGEVIGSKDIGDYTCVSFNYDSSRVASITDEGILIWSTDIGTTIYQIVYAKERITLINLSNDDYRLAALTIGDHASRILVWQGEDQWNLLLEIPCHCAIFCAFSPDGSRVAASFDDGNVQIWKISDDTATTAAERGRNSSSVVIDMPIVAGYSQKIILSEEIITIGGTINWWKNNGSHVKTLSLNNGQLGKYTHFSPDHNTFITITDDGHLCILTPLTIDEQVPEASQHSIVEIEY